jgi:hypothetical protein
MLLTKLLQILNFLSGLLLHRETPSGESLFLFPLTPALTRQTAGKEVDFRKFKMV